MASVRELAPELSVVVAYGHILSREVLDLPGRGSINVHASLLPELRGAAPISWAIVRGLEVTAVTVMRMVEGMDAGPILFQMVEPIGPYETASELTTRLSEIGAQALVETLTMLQLGEVVEREQDHALATYAPKVNRAPPGSTGPRTPSRSPTICAAWTRCRAREPPGGRAGQAFPAGAPTGTLRRLVSWRCSAGGSGGRTPGRVRGDAVALGEVQPTGRLRMPAADWIRGRSVVAGDRFE